MAGQKGAVTISTNMAGRGTDIVLGEGVKALGGLHILGTERHESRRIDNQLRGRSGRQGDAGSSRYFLSLEDDLLRIFGGEKIQFVMEKLGMEDGEPIEHKFISKAIENAQRKVEGHNFDIRKHLLEYDDVMNQQRTVLYKMRRDILDGQNIKEFIENIIGEYADEIAAEFVEPKAKPETWDSAGINEAVLKQFDIKIASENEITADYDEEKLSQFIYDTAMNRYHARAAGIGPEFDGFERFLVLQTVDNRWKDHLLSMDHLKEGIGLRGYAQQNPLIVYKKEAFDMFQFMIDRIKEEIVNVLFRFQVRESDNLDEMKHEEEKDWRFSGGDEEDSKNKTIKRDNSKIGRNDPCPCGSNRKYKRCCGK